MRSDLGQDVIARYTDTGRDAAELRTVIEDAWSEILDDPAALAEVSGILGVPEAVVAYRLRDSPVVAVTGSSGLTVAEGAVLICVQQFVASVLGDSLKDLAKDVVVSSVKKVWARAIKPRVEGRIPFNALGREDPER